MTAGRESGGLSYTKLFSEVRRELGSQSWIMQSRCIIFFGRVSCITCYGPKMAEGNCELCFLCLKDVGSGTWKTKRRKMLGDAARLAVEVMDVLASCSFGVILSSHVVNKEHTFLCHKCKNLAESIEALTKKVKSAESELVIMIEKRFMETIGKRN